MGNVVAFGLGFLFCVLALSRMDIVMRLLKWGVPLQDRPRLDTRFSRIWVYTCLGGATLIAGVGFIGSFIQLLT